MRRYEKSQNPVSSFVWCITKWSWITALTASKQTSSHEAISEHTAGPSQEWNLHTVLFMISIMWDPQAECDEFAQDVIFFKCNPFTFYQNVTRFKLSIQDENNQLGCLKKKRDPASALRQWEWLTWHTPPHVNLFPLFSLSQWRLIIETVHYSGFLTQEGWADLSAGLFLTVSQCQ